MIKPIAFILLLCLVCPAFADAQAAAGPFPDVPADHWAAGAVKRMAESGIMKGYPGGEFKGDKPVTRYELAAALQRFARFIEAGRAPLVPAAGSKSEPGKLLAPRSGPQAPAQSGVTPSKAPNWAKTSLDYLVSGGFIPRDSPLLTDGDKPVGAELLAQSLASVVFQVAVLDADGAAEKSGETKEQVGTGKR